MKKVITTISLIALSFTALFIFRGDGNTTSQVGVRILQTIPQHGHSGPDDGGVLKASSCNVWGPNSLTISAGQSAFIDWNNVVYDPLHLYSVSDKTKFTIPKGYNYARAYLTIGLLTQSSTEQLAMIDVFKNTNTSIGLNTWTASTLPSSASWSSVAFGNGTFVAVDSGPTSSNKAAYSIDNGKTWNASTMSASARWISVAYGNGVFVAVTWNTSNVAAYSTNNGQTWTASTLPSSVDWSSVTYGNGVFVAVAGYNVASNAAAYSTDNGQTWNSATLPASLNWKSVAYGNGVFVATGLARPAYSTDNGQTWAYGGTPDSLSYSVAFGSVTFAIVPGGISANSYYSTDGGITWTVSSMPSIAGWSSVTYGNGAFVSIASGPSNKAAYSSDEGQTWLSTATLPSSASWSSVAFGNGVFVAVSGLAGSSNKAAYTTFTNSIYRNGFLVKNSTSYKVFSLSTLLIPVTEGDYLRFSISNNTGTNTIAVSNTQTYCYFELFR